MGNIQFLQSKCKQPAKRRTENALIKANDQVGLSVDVMNMVRSDIASSGVIFTLDTATGFRDDVFITASYGLGENIVQGAVDPDEFLVRKPTLDRGRRAVLRRNLGAKKLTMIYASGRTRESVRNVPTSGSE